MKNVIVTLPIKEGGCDHLRDKILALDDGEAWWNFSRLPLHIDVDSKLYIVCDGAIRGYFVVEGFEPEPIQGKYHPTNDYFQVFLRNWTILDPPKPMKGFQGFRYWKDE